MNTHVKYQVNQIKRSGNKAAANVRFFEGTMGTEMRMNPETGIEEEVSVFNADMSTMHEVEFVFSFFPVPDEEVLEEVQRKLDEDYEGLINVE